MKIYLKNVLIIICAVLIFSGCSLKKDLSGSYNIEEFLNLLKPVFDLQNDMPEYATDDEKADIKSKAYQDGLVKVGFTGEEHIIINGKLDFFSPGSKSNCTCISLTDNNKTNSIFIYGDYKNIGWVPLLGKEANIKVEFDVKYIKDNVLDFINCKILSPSKVEYKSDCSTIIDDKLIMGTISNIKTFDISEKDMDEAINSAINSFDSNDYYWFLAMKYSDKFITVKDSVGYEIGVFVKEDINPNPVNIGDKIACYGDIYEINKSGYPEKFMDSTLLGGYYIFD